jgi:hypothetical protein
MRIFFQIFKEALESIERWNGKSEGHLGVWAIVPKDGEFAGNYEVKNTS